MSTKARLPSQPSQPSPAPDSAVHIPVKEAAGLVEGLSHVVKNYRLYSRRIEAVQEQVAQLYKRFLQYLDQHSILSLRIEPSEIALGTEVIYREQGETGETFFYKLYRDGIRQVSFHPELQLEELSDFLVILASAPEELERQDADLVTLLWKRDLRGIGHIVVETFSDDSQKSDLDAAVDEILYLLNSKHPPTSSVRTARLSEQDTGLTSAVLEKVPSLEDLGSQRAEEVFELEEEELRAHLKEMEEQEKDLHLVKLVDILLRVLEEEKEPERFEEIGELLLLTLDSLLLDEDYDLSSRLVKRIRDFTQRDSKRPEEVRQAAERLLKGAGALHRLRHIILAFNQGAAPKRSGLEEFVLSLDPEALFNLASLMGELTHLQHRRFLGEILYRAFPDDPTVFVTMLKSERHFVVREAAHFLSRERGWEEDIVPALKEAAKHPHPEVREDILKSLMGFLYLRDVEELFWATLDDPHPGVRATALKLLVYLRGDGAMKGLVERIQGPAFLHRPAEEKLEFFRALGKLGSSPLLPFLASILERKGWFRRGVQEELHLGAILATRQIGGEPAKQLLQKVERGWLYSPRVRRACRRALQEMESSRRVEVKQVAR